MLDSIFSRLVRGSWRRAALALGLFCVAGTAQATSLNLPTPAGLNPGDTFRFLFVTSTTRNATSTDIADYNSFVNTDAGGATYDGATVNWKAVGSTATVAARDNVGGFGTNVPVYLSNGTRLADDLTTNAGGLWGGNLRAVPNITIDGLSLGGSETFTGSLSDGTMSTEPLGNITAMRGVTDVTTSSWIEGASSFYGVSYRFYGLSDDLTVASAVPEIDPAGIGSVLALVTGALGLLERRRLKVT
jgi:hypothetical protein